MVLLESGQGLMPLLEFCAACLLLHIVMAALSSTFPLSHTSGSYNLSSVHLADHLFIPSSPFPAVLTSLLL